MHSICSKASRLSALLLAGVVGFGSTFSTPAARGDDAQAVPASLKVRPGVALTASVTASVAASVTAMPVRATPNGNAGNAAQPKDVRVKELAGPARPDSRTDAPSAAKPAAPAQGVAFPFKARDVVAFVGSSSTQIGTWPKTVEFLLRTRHPELGLEFRRCGLGGATFASAADKVEDWLGDTQPTLVFYNFGANDAGAGDKGLGRFDESMARCVQAARWAGARVFLVTPQGADPRKAGAAATVRRKAYAENMLAYGQAHAWPVIDIHHPIAALQSLGQADNARFTINRDNIHLTEAAYVAWGFYLYGNCHPADSAKSAATVSADGAVVSATRCQVSDVHLRHGVLSFVRSDEVLPILPPTSLPPAKYVPLESLSQYLLSVPGLSPEARYEISCEGKPLGVVDGKALSAGVNLNSVLLASGRPAPWADLAKSVWSNSNSEGSSEGIGQTHWRFEIRRQWSLSVEDVPVIGQAIRSLRSKFQPAAPASPLAGAARL